MTPQSPNQWMGGVEDIAFPRDERAPPLGQHDRVCAIAPCTTLTYILPHMNRDKSVCNRSSHHNDLHTPTHEPIHMNQDNKGGEYVGQCGVRSDCTHSCYGTFVASNSHAQSFLHAFLFSINF